jgi:hypothetical protein
MSLTPNTPRSSAPMIGQTPVPNQLAVIAPLETVGPITYQTLLEYLDAGPVPYQLWLLTQVATGEASVKSSADSVRHIADSGKSQWAYSPEFSPVNGVDATPVAWPNSGAPRVITIQYEGLGINQAINWAIRQAHGDMILVLDSGLSGLMQLRQALDDISMSISRTEVATVVEESAPTREANLVADMADMAVPTAFNRRLVSRLEQWGTALQQQAAQSPSRRPVSPNETPVVAAASSPDSVTEPTINRVDGESHVQPAKKLPKFITRFHEFI